MTTEDGIDVDKLTNDAFAAIDSLFSDDDDEEAIFDESDVLPEEDPLSDFDRIREFMLAMEWEYSEDEILKFDRFLIQIMPNYPDQYNQDTLKMMSSIVRYIIKAKSATAPETYFVLDAVTKTFNRINSGLDEAKVSEEVKAVYQKVVALKSKISASHTDVGHLDGGSQQNAAAVDSGGGSKSARHSSSTSDDSFLDRSVLNELMKRLAISENKLLALEARIETLSSVNRVDEDEMTSRLRNLESRIDSLEAMPSAVDKAPSIASLDDGAISDDDFDLGGDLASPFELSEEDGSLSRQDGPLHLDPGAGDSLLDVDVNANDFGEDGEIGEVDSEEISFDDMDLADTFFEEAGDGVDDPAFAEVSPDEMTFDSLLFDDEDPVFEADDSDEHDTSSQFTEVSPEDLFDDPHTKDEPDGIASSDIDVEADDDADVYVLNADEIEYDELAIGDIFYEAPPTDDGKSDDVTDNELSLIEAVDDLVENEDTKSQDPKEDK